MAGERRTKGLASDNSRRTTSRGATRVAGDDPQRSGRGKNAVAKGRGRHKGEAKVIPLPQGRRSKRSGKGVDQRPARKAVGRWRLRLVVGMVALVCLSLGARAAQLSVTKDTRYQAFASEQRPQAAAEDRYRGSVVSSDDRPLATSLEAAEIVATPYQVRDPRGTAEVLAEVLGSEAGDASEIEAKLSERNEDGSLSGYSIVAEKIEPEKAREIRELGLVGVSVAPDAVRAYPNGQLASQLIGHLGADRAYGGIEARYDEELKSGQEVPLTLDTAVQQELERVLLDAAKEYEGKKALGLVMRVEDGAILALANVPSYDNNNFGEASAEEQRNRVLTDPYEPGSTFKPFTMAAALEEGAVGQDSTFVVPDAIPVADRMIYDSEVHETKVLNTGDILAESSNVGTIQVAQAVGGERLSERIVSFGFGEETGVDLWGEDRGVIPSFEEWSGSSIGNIPIGQGITVTPMRLAAGYAALANGGLEVTPYVARSSAPSEPGRRVISERTSSIVRGMLQGVVDEGTGHLAQIPGYTVAGKTGTAQKVDPEAGSYGDEYVTSFIGYAPAKDPKYLTLMVVDEPQKDIFGEVVAAPAFQDVMGFTLSYYNVPPDRESTKNDPPPPDPTPAPNARKEDRLR
jgi:cell division protein FtsI (penicillin-binding protein 3)